MEHDDRDPAGPPALLHIDPVPVPHIQHALVERVDRGIKMTACAAMSGDLVHESAI